jgi:PAS domain S-box-containing protein
MSQDKTDSKDTQSRLSDTGPYPDQVNLCRKGEKKSEKLEADKIESFPAEEELKRERELLQTIMNSAGNAHLVYLDRDFNFVRVNETYASSCGYRSEEMIGKNHFTLYPHVENEAIFARVRDTGEAVEFHDKPFEFPDQPERGVTYWDWTLVPVKDQAGQVSGLIFSLFETTARKRAELDLQKNEERYRLLVEQTLDGIFVGDATGRCLDVNTAGCQMLGYSREELLELTVADVIAEEDVKRISSEITRLANGQVISSEWRVRRKNGSFFIGEVLGRQLPDGRVQAILRDITGRKKAEEKLKESEERFRSVLNNSLDVIYRFNLQTGRYEYMSPAIRQMGFEPEEMTSMTNEEILSRVHPDDLEGLRKDLAQLAEKGAGSCEYRFFNKDGLYRWWSNQLIITNDENGKPLYRDGYVRDITERKKAEEALRRRTEEFQTVLDTTPVPIFMTHDPECHKITGNSAAQELVKLRPDANISKTAPAVERPSQWQEMRDGVPIDPEDLPLQRAARGEEVRGYEMDLVFEDGTVKSVVGNAMPIRDENGKSRGGVAILMEITERKRAEEALRESQAKLQSAFASITEAIFIADAEGRLIEFNDEFVRYHRFKDREECSRTIADCPMYLDVWFADGTPAPLEQWAMPRALRGETASNVEYRLRRKETGETWWGSYNFGPLRDRDGNIKGAVVAGREITALKKAEEALRESENRMQQALKVSGSFTFEWNTTTDRVLRSESCSSILGLKGEEAIYDIGQRFFQRIHPEDREQFIQLIKGMTPTKNSYTTEYRVMGGDGKTVTLEEIGQATFDDSDKLKRLVGVTTDITKRKEAELLLYENEQRLNLALESGQMGTWEWDVQSNYALWNDREYRLLGLPVGSGREPSDEFFRRVHPDDLASLNQSLTDVIKEGDDWYEEFRIIRPDREVRWLAAVGKIYRDFNGQAKHVIGLNYDITDRKLAEEALRKAHDELENRVQERTAELSATIAQLERLNQELQEFTFIASHDLQEPLRKIEIFGDMVQKRSASLLDPTSQDQLARLLRSTARMRQLLRDLLVFSRVATKTEPFKPVDLEKTVREAIEILELRVKETGAEIRIDPIPGFEADESQIRQLFQNLIANAMKYRGRNAPRIKISGREIDQKTCEILVADNGMGFDMRYAKDIFKPFERLHGRSAYEGTGMGLAICRKIVERHGGTIHAESEPGKGTTFVIRLPLKQVRQERH